jgi:aspartate aminotransferase
MAVAAHQTRILEALRPFIDAITESGPAAAEPGACDFLAGNPEVAALPGYVETLGRWLEPRHRRWFAYGMADPAAQEAAAASLASNLGLSFEAEDIVLTRGAHGALALAMSMVLDPGDEVVFVSPPWFFYEALILGAHAEPIRVRADEATWDLDLDAIERALTPATRLVLVNTPNNPTGRIYPNDTLRRLGALLERHSAAIGRTVYLLSDESYSRILFDGNQMVTPAAHYPASMLVHTFSKSVLAPAQRLGYLALPPAIPDRETLRSTALTSALATGNTLPDAVMQYALPELEHIVLDMNRLHARRDHMLGALRDSGYRVDTPEATFYLLVRSPVPDDIAFARRLREGMVLVLPGAAFEMPGWFRISLTATDEMVDRALPVFGRAIAERR